MSINEAYRLAHTAQCRLHMSASAPDRNLRFVVGHLMHYENLRLRIVEMEHEVSMGKHSSGVKFKGTGNVCTKDEPSLQKKPSTGQLGRKSPPPPATAKYDPYEDDEIDDDDPWSGGDEDDDGGEDLGLERFPSGSARPPRQPQPPPDLLPDDDSSEEEEDDPISPEEPDQEILEKLLKTPGSKDMSNLYDGIRKCPCHGHENAPSFEQMWELPSNKEGVTRAVAQVWV